PPPPPPPPPHLFLSTPTPPPQMCIRDSPGTPPAIQRPQLPGESAQEAAGRLMALSPSLPEFSWEHEPEPVEVLPEPAVCEECLQAAQDELEGFATR
ncbi:hypothetical protein QN388_24565, partial [Pseudomonas sp. 5B4]|nr:hypothetical protein [Pseudomonas sp. 5B4]